MARQSRRHRQRRGRPIRAPGSGRPWANLEALEQRLLLSHDLLQPLPDAPQDAGGAGDSAGGEAPLEPTQLLYTAPSGNGPDRLLLRYDSDSGDLEILDADTSDVLASQALLETSDVLVVGADDTDTTDETDTLTVDFTGAFSMGIEFRGGTGGADSLVIEGGSFTTVTYEATGPGAGGIDFDGDGITYTGLEPVLDESVAGARVFVGTASGETIRLAGDGTSENDRSRIDDGGTGAFESITFRNPTDSLRIDAGDGDDRVVLAGLDALFGAAIALDGEDGDDTLQGPDAARTWNITGGGAGNVGGPGVLDFASMENLDGGSGDDTFAIAGGAGVSGTLDGGGGRNTLDYSAWADAVTADLGAGTAAGSGGVSGVHNVLGGAGDDTLAGDDAANRLEGGDGGDVLTGGGGDDALVGGAGDDTYAFGDDWGADTVGELAGGGDDALDFAAYAGTLALGADGSVTGSDGSTMAYSDEVAERLADGDVELDADAQAALLDGLERLVDWAGELARHGDFARALPLLRQDLGDFGLGQVDVSLGAAMDVADALDQLRGRVEAYFEETGPATATGLATRLKGWMADARRHLNPGDAGVVTIAADVADGETVTIGSTTYEFDTNSTVEPGHVAVSLPDLSPASARSKLVDAITANPAGRAAAAEIHDQRVLISKLLPDDPQPGLADTLGDARNAVQSLARDAGDLKLGDLDVAVGSDATLSVSFLPDGSAEILLDLDYQAERTTAFDIDLGADADLLGWAFDARATVDLATSLAADMTLGLALGDEPVFLLDVDDLRVRAAVDAGDLNFGLNFGFFAASIGDGVADDDPGNAVDEGSIHLDGTLAVSFQDPAGDGSWISLDELDTATTDVGDLVNVSLTVDQMPSAHLPVQVDATGLADSVVGRFAGEVIETASGVFWEYWTTFSDAFRDLANIRPQDFLGVFEQLGGWFESLTSSETWAIDIPLVFEGVIGQSLQFGRVVRDDLLTPLYEMGTLGFGHADLAIGGATFLAEEPPAGPLLARDLTIHLQLNDGEELSGTLRAGDTTDNLTFDDLADDAEAAIQAIVDAAPPEAGLAGLSVEAGMEDFRLTLKASRTSGGPTGTLKVRLPGIEDTSDLIAAFDSAQELADALGELLGPAGIDYDPATRDMTIPISWSRVLPATASPADFAIDLGDFAHVESSSTLDLAAQVGFDFVFGVNLAPGGQITISPPIFEPALPADGVLSADATFDLAVYDQLDSGDVKVAAFAVTVARNDGNTTVEELAADVQGALDAKLIAAGLAAGDVLAEASFDRIALTPRSTQVTDADTGLPQWVDRRLEITTDDDDPAYGELGLLTAPTRYDGRLAADAAFTLVVDGTEYGLVVPAAATAGNATIEDLLADINRAVNLALEGDAATEAEVQAVRVSEGGNRIAFRRTIDGAPDDTPTLALRVGDDPDNGAVTGLGFEPGFQSLLRARATEFFLEGAAPDERAVLSGEIAVDAAGIAASATLGFLGVDVTGSAGTVEADAVLELVDPETGAGRVSLSTLLMELGQSRVLYDADAKAGVIDASIEGEMHVELAVEARSDFPLADGAVSANVTLDLDRRDWLARPPVLDDVTDGDAIRVGIDAPTPDAVEAFERLRNIGFDDVIAALDGVADYLRELAGTGPRAAVAEVLETDLPLIDRSIADLLDVADQVAGLARDLAQSPVETVQSLGERIEDYLPGLDVVREQLGLGPEDLGVDLAVDTSSGTPALKLGLYVGAAFEDSLPFNLDLQDLAALAGGSPFPAAFTKLVGLNSSGELSAALGGSLTLAMGIDLAGAPAPFLYTGPDGTKLSLSAEVSGTDLDFTAQIGPFGLFVVDGEAELTGGIDVALAGGSGGRHYLAGRVTSGDVVVDVDGSASVSLPLFFPDPDTPVGGDEAANALKVTIASLADFLERAAEAVVVEVPDFSALTAPTPLGMISNPDVLIDGLDTVLLTLQDALGAELFGASLPLIGDALAEAGQFIERFREDLVAPLSFQLRQGGGGYNPVDMIQDVLFDVFASSAQGAEKLFDSFGALGILCDTDGDGAVTRADVVKEGFGLTDDYGQFELALGQSYVWDETVAFDLGLPAIGLAVDAGVELEIGWSLNFGFGVDQARGFYFLTQDPDELSLAVTARLTSATGGPASASGTLGFLAVDVTDMPGDDRTELALDFTVDLADLDDDGRLTMGEMIASSGRFGDVVRARATGGAHVGLAVNVNFGALGLDAAVLPSLGFDFVMDWDFLQADPGAGIASFGGLPDVALRNIGLDLGSFISDFASPVLSRIGKILEPLDWLLDAKDGLLFRRLPVISSLAGHTVTIKDLAEELDQQAKITPFLNAVLEAYRLVDLVTDAAADARGGNLVIPFGDLVLSGSDGNGGRAGILPDLRSATNADLQGAGVPDDRPDPDLDAIGGSGKAREFAKTITRGEGAFHFDLLKPENVFKLLLGQPDVTLVTYELPELGFSFEYFQEFPIWGPLAVTLRGAVSAGVDLAVGYDTRGVEQFRRSGNALDLLNGFYVNDLDLTSGKDVAEAFLKGTIAAGAALSAKVARAGAEGGIDSTIFFNLNDPDRDGKVRLGEMLANVEANWDDFSVLAPLAVFDIRGLFEAFLRVYLEIDLAFTSYEKSMEIARVKLYEYDVPFHRPPVLAQVTELDGEEVLLLNMGPNAEARYQGDLSDGNETFTLTQAGSAASPGDITVTAFGYSQTYENVERIVAWGGEGNDTIDAGGVFVPVALHGGGGNDKLTGGAGDDRILGEGGDDELAGGGGADRLDGGLGGDTLRGDAGDDELLGGDGRDTLTGGDGDDALVGGAGNDALAGGAGSDTYRFANADGKDTVDDAAGEADTWDFTAVTADIGATMDAGGAKAGFPRAESPEAAGNAVRETGHLLAVEVVLGGRGADAFVVSHAGPDGVLLDGRGGSETYTVQASGAGLPTVRLRDQGNPWDTDAAIVLGSPGADVLTVTDTAVAGESGRFEYNASGGESGIETLRVQLGAGNDDLIVQSTPGSMSVALAGEAGDDRFTVGDADEDTDAVGVNAIDGQTLTGPLFIDGGKEGEVDGDTLVVDDGADTAANKGTVTDKAVTGLGMAVGIDYRRVEALDVRLGDGDDELVVLRTIPGATTVSAGGGADDVEIISAAGTLTVNGRDGLDDGADDGADTITLRGSDGGSVVTVRGDGGADEINVVAAGGEVTAEGGQGDDAIHVGSAAPADTGGIVDNIGGDVTVTGGEGQDALTVDDSGENTASQATLTGEVLTGLGLGGELTYGELDDLLVRLGSAADTVNVRGTSAKTTIEAGAGNDAIHVSDDAPTGAGSLDDVAAELILDAGAGVANLLHVSDAGDADADTDVRIDAGSVRGLAPADITYRATGGSFGGGIEVRGGSGGNTFTVTGVSPDAVTALHAGAGAATRDSVAVQLTGGTGLLVAHGQAGDDVLDAAASMIGVVLDGGAGGDEVTGGSGADTLGGGAGADVILGGGGDDEVWADGDFEVDAATRDLTVQSADDPTYADEVHGGEGRDAVHGGSGDDEIHGDAGEDELFGDAGADVIEGGEGADDIHGGEGADELHGGTEADDIHGDEGGDTIHGDEGADTVHGGGGDDEIYGDAGGDELHGDAGADVIEGGEGADLIRGGDGDDELFGNAGGDTIHGDGDADVIHGDEDADTVYGRGRRRHRGQRRRRHDPRRGGRRHDPRRRRRRRGPRRRGRR